MSTIKTPHADEADLIGEKHRDGPTAAAITTVYSPSHHSHFVDRTRT
ncbi:hypothetical protein ABZX74_17300 [Streptomyces olivaceoviridis]